MGAHAPVIPYARHHITAEDEAAVLRALRSGYLTQGPEAEALEHEWAELVGAKYAVACSSGTAALWLAYHTAFAAQAKPRIAPVTFVATAAAWTGETRWLDCDRETGLAIDADVYTTLGGQHHLRVSGTGPAVVDACHGPYHHFGDLWTVFSLHPAKHVACGEGGMLATDDAELATQAKKLRNHGQRIFADGSRVVEHRGLNWRLDEMSAALARSQMTRLQANIDARRLIAAQYDEAFAGKVATVPHRADSARHLYQLLVEDRDVVQQRLKTKGIGTAVHYPLWMAQPAFRYLGYKPGTLPNAEWHSARTLSIPLFPTMTEQEIDTVIQGVLACAS